MHRAISEGDTQYTFGLIHRVDQSIAELHAVGRDLLTAVLHGNLWPGSLVSKYAVHVCRKPVAWASGVDHQDPASGAT